MKEIKIKEYKINYFCLVLSQLDDIYDTAYTSAIYHFVWFVEIDSA